MKPRVLFVGRGRLTLPLAPWLARKWDALDEVLDLRVLNAGSGSGDPRFTLLPDRAEAFYPRLVYEIARTLRSFRPEVIVASDPYVGGAALAGRRRQGTKTAPGRRGFSFRARRLSRGRGRSGESAWV